ncbi:MAG: hypothetical protein CMP76_17230 [Flavobacterium sp.]|uniref:head-tail connector protein n=1 Tax=Flavobacterium sp. TaxID=239 RepID=UPI000C3E03C1|nr:head-tail connector protein [Flavobacterium sp.]MBF05022.1 hypothetical protein [Flavobacterium sp.]|tara:strand:- start:203 stop:844 length:642 start_codon:yes stop_codon:yes gene_type:complete
MKNIVLVLVLMFSLNGIAKVKNSFNEKNSVMVTDVQITNETAVDVLALVKAKKHLRVDSSFTDEDDLIQDYIDAAVINAENYIGGHIQPKIMVFKMDQFDNPLTFEAFPLKEVVSVKYYENGNDTQLTMDSGDYQLTKLNSKVFSIHFKGDLPSIQERFDAVEVSVKVGMVTIEKPIVQAVQLMVSDMYERREDRIEVISSQSMSLLRPYKKF